MESIRTSLFIVSILFFSSAEAICVSRKTLFNQSSPSPTPSPSPSAAPAPASATAASGELSSHTVNGLLSSALTVTPAVKDICDKTDYSLLCISSLLPYAAHGKPDVLYVLSMEIKACVEASQHALAEVARMAEEPSTPSATRKSLTVCKENYDDAIENLKDAVAALPAGDIGRLNSVLSATLSDFSTCEDAFAESAPGARSPTVQFYDPLRKLASNCLAIASLIHA